MADNIINKVTNTEVFSVMLNYPIVYYNCFKYTDVEQFIYKVVCDIVRGFFAVVHFAVKKKLVSVRLASVKFFFYGELSHGEKS